MNELRIAFSSVYRYTLPAKHRFPMVKYDLLPEQLIYEGTVTPEHFFEPRLLTEAEICSVHTREYWNALRQQSLTRKEERAIGFPMRPELVTRGRYIAAGTLECAEHVLKHGGIALNIAGGTHHAYADHGEGFCVFNDIALAAKLLLNRNRVNKIFVVDLDVHQGNGTAHIFKDEDRVFTLSMHGAKNYPTRKEESDLDIGLDDYTSDSLYLDTLYNVLPQLLDMVKPEIVFYLSGVDIIKSDALGRLSVSIDGCLKRDEFVFEECLKRNLPVAVSMGGGYSPTLSHIIEAHANTYRAAARLLS